MADVDPYGTRAELLPGVSYHRLGALAVRGIGDVSRLPVTLKILLENSVRNSGAPSVRAGDVEAIARWDGTGSGADRERAFMPARVLLQDFTGVPAVVDLAAMRSAVARNGGDPMRIDPLVPVDLVIDHSVQVDAFGNREAYERNIAREYERNRERYSLLRWAQQAFQDFRVVPPGMGIVHQINLEYLAQVVQVRDIGGVRMALPDTLVGTDSHTPMVNGIGVLGWGVGGIEAEACMLGQPLFLLAPVVVGVRFHNALPAGTTATDLVLTLTELLRSHGVVNKFVEFCGSGLSSMSVPDRATLSNMSPEFGATASLFPIDARTLEYLRDSGRDRDHIDLVERYAKEQGMFRTDDLEIPIFSEMVELDLAGVVPSVAGPKRPQDRVALPHVWESFTDVWAQRTVPASSDALGEDEVSRLEEEGGIDPEAVAEEPVPNGPADSDQVRDGSVVIAAITSCTNTSNPTVMVAAGLLARNAVARGLMPPEYVKTSLAPGSRVVTDYLERAGLLGSLEQLRFNLVGYGCTTCIGNSGPLPELVAERIDAEDLTVAAVLSGNRNFEGRIHPQVRAAYLASPPLVVAYALAGRLDIDLTSDFLGTGHDGQPVFLSDIWPSADEVTETVRAAIGSDLYTREYARIFDGDEHWQQLPSPAGALFDWDAESTYVREPPYFVGMSPEPTPPDDIIDARVLALLGDSITTDHISPAGSIAGTSPAAAYLREHGVEPRDFNTYGARRGNHDVMVRGTFANIRLHNQLADGKEGGFTVHLPDGALMTIFEASELYQQDGVPLIVIAGREYGSGSSRDWAAKGPLLQGVRAVIAELYERIHRSNLVGMGILPLQFRPGEGAETLGLDGTELYTIRGVAGASPGSTVHVSARRAGQADIEFGTVSRLDSETDVEYLRNGGILPLVLRQLMDG